MTRSGRGGFAALDNCVHCGFCLQACPTFLATGDEADGPRGRIALMRALEQGELAPDDAGLNQHLDRCLGCRGCEPVCPSGVGYGAGLEAARARLVERRPPTLVARVALAAMTSPIVSGIVYALARAARGSRVPERLAGWGRLRFAMGMLAATRADGRIGGLPDRVAAAIPSAHPPIRRSAVLLFRGCVMEGLFSHVHDATIRTLGVNGHAVSEVPGQVCCGALHAHAGLHRSAQALARRNIAAFGPGDAPIVVNSAGCGAQLKGYGALLDGEPAAVRFAARVRDVTEILAERGPAPGAPLPLRVAYDAPCHLLHVQRVAEPPLAVLRAIPALDVRLTADSAQCCGSAGLYGLLQPELSRAVLTPKLSRLLEDPPDVLATGNPGCVMQLGAGLLAARTRVGARHPVELLDVSYRAAGFYR
ncbi:MAG TPA: heterodisulfide reductase-related iron-sulfur binding cluster [Gemmatimonadales bacterium]